MLSRRKRQCDGDDTRPEPRCSGRERATVRRLIDEINEFTVEATGNPRIRELLTVETDSHSELVAGKARYLGASSMWAWRFAKMQHAAERHDWTRFISIQDQYSLLAREEEREMFGLLADQGVGSIPWSPSPQASSPGRGDSEARRARRPTRPSTRSADRCGSTATRRSSTSSPASRSKRRSARRPGCSVSPWTN